MLLVCMGCNSDSEKDSTFIGGRIVNPNTNYLTLEQNSQVIDTIRLDPNHNFAYTFEQDKESIYTFTHHPEIQTIYLKPGDSSVFRVNTMEFDESLTFGGDSSEENNFLINMFLLNEQDNDLILSYYKLSPSEFINKTDSLRALRLKKFEDLNAKMNFSQFFQNIARSTVNYEHYDMKERYAFLIKKYIPERFDELPNSYFDYRSSVNYNDKDLVSNFSYMRFLDNYLRNKSIELCEDRNIDCYDLNNHQNLKKRLNLVYELFDHNYLKTNFFNRLIRREIVFSRTQSQLDETLSIIEKFEIPDLDEQELHHLTEIQSRYLIGSSLKKHEFRSTSSETVLFQDITNNKPSLVYTWSSLSMDLKRKYLEKINTLKEKYPEYNFISVNLDFQNKRLWASGLKQLKYDYGTEFQLISDTPAHRFNFYRNYLNKVYILDSSSTILENSLSLNDPRLETYLANLAAN